MHVAYESYSKPRLSRHAQARMQQRSIPSAVVYLLLDFADPRPAGEGCQRFAFTKRSITDARRALGRSAKALDRYLNAYVVVTEDNLVITAARAH